MCFASVHRQQYTCESPLRDDKNAMVLPSGDHFAEESFPLRVN